MKIYSKSFCPYCQRLITLLDVESISYELIDIVESPGQTALMQALSGNSGVPQVAVGNVIIYDYGTEETLVDDIRKILSRGTVTESNSSDLTSQFVFLGK
ncbi:MAG: glutaredoxin domain-containing protein [bacterium]